MGKLKDKIQNIKMPHTYVILTMILLTVVALTYIIPAGEYDRILDPVSNKMIVIPESFHFTQGVRPGFFDIFLALQRGYVSAANILFLIIFAYGYVYVLIDNGTLSSLINCLIKAMGSRTYLIIPVSMLAFGILGSTMGIYEEVYGMVPVFVGIAAALGYDVVVGGAIVFVGIATGRHDESLFHRNRTEHCRSADVLRPWLPRRYFCSFSDGVHPLCYVVCEKGKGPSGKIGAFWGKAGYASRA